MGLEIYKSVRAANIHQFPINSPLMSWSFILELDLRKGYETVYNITALKSRQRKKKSTEEKTTHIAYPQDGCHDFRFQSRVEVLVRDTFFHGFKSPSWNQQQYWKM